MKKIIKIITIIGSFFIMSKNCYAISIVKENINPDIKIHLKTDNINETRKIHKAINQSTSEHLYSIHLKKINYNNSYDDYDFYGGMNPLNIELQTKIGLITYFGYGYQNRNDIKWYIITQYMIWSELVKEANGEIYFVDNNNNKIDLYEEEIKDILDDINHFYKVPSFLEDNKELSHEIKLTESLNLADENNILEEFNIIPTSNDLEYKIINNEFRINPISPNVVSIEFKRKTEELSGNMKVYTNYNQEELINRGNIGTISRTLIVTISNPLIKIKSNISPKYSIKNNAYKIFTEKGSEYYNFTLDQDGTANIDLQPGKYYIKQTKSAYGYKLNTEEIHFEVKKEDMTIELKNELETKNVTIEKQLIKDDNSISPAVNATLDIIDENGKLVSQIKTNNEGQALIELSYGKYTIKENNTRSIKENYTITIDENFDENKPVIIKEEITTEDIKEEINKNNNNKGNIIINKYDFRTGKPLSGIKIALYNKDKELIKEEVTDNYGRIIFKDLETGIYYIKEIYKDNDYELDDAIKIEVKEGIDTIVTSNNRTEIEVPNTKSNSTNLSVLILLFIGAGIKYTKLKNV